MGILDFFKSKGDKKETLINEPEKKPYYGDLSKTKILRELFETPLNHRNEEWKNNFLKNVIDASFVCGNPQVVEGPDGYPYFQLNIPEANKEFQCYVIRHMKNDFLLEKGYGIVINSYKGNPDWVFSYGDIVNFHIRNEFYSQSNNWISRNQDIEVIKEKEEVLIGQPSESILPGQTRMVLRDLMNSLGLNDVKVLLMNRRKPGEEYSQELVFNLTPDKFEKKEHYEGVMRIISWYLPRHYTYVSMHEAILKDGFKPL